MNDAFFMKRALTLASKGKQAWPNPKVGCVLVKNGRVVGEGWHKKAGEPHAEPQALAMAGAKAKGATAYVNLEPCCGHPGKRTPPCADRLIAAGVKRVVFSIEDPNPGVAGKGMRQLRKAGVKVLAGVLEREGAALNAPFLRVMRDKRPYVILKSALSLDGKAAAVGGASKWITSPAARKAGHALRARVDAILTGVGTILADDPRLTAHGAGRDPRPVILDTRLRTPRRARVLRSRPLIYTASTKTLTGAEVVRVPRKGGRLDLKAVLADLAKRKIGTLLLEGGPTIHASFLAAGAVDEVYAFVSPKLLAGTRDPNAAPTLKAPRLTRMGPDFLFFGRL